MVFLTLAFNLVIIAAPSTAFATAEPNLCRQEWCPITQENYTYLSEKFAEMYPQISWEMEWDEKREKAEHYLGTIKITGGFARNPLHENLGSLMTIICHEIGHAVHDYTEGEADYFATNICLKKYFSSSNDKNDLIALQYTTAPASIKSTCLKSFANYSDQLLCLRVSSSSYSAASFSAKHCSQKLLYLHHQFAQKNKDPLVLSDKNLRCLREEASITSHRFKKSYLLDLAASLSDKLSEPLNFLVEDIRVVNTTYHQHNSPSCRMYTFRNGVLNLPRPNCWYAD